MKKLPLSAFRIFLLLCIFSSCVTKVLDKQEMVSWTEHYKDKTAIGSGFQRSLVIASGTSDVRVASLPYNMEREADIYYPPDMDLHEPRGAVILVVGDSDQHAKDWCQRALKDTDKFLQWGQVIAEHGMVAVAYGIGNPGEGLKNITSWLDENSKFLGIDTSRIGFFSTNENGCAIGMETLIIENKNYTGPKPVFNIFYYGMLPLLSRKEIYSDVPIMIVQAEDNFRNVNESMDKFITRAEAVGAPVTKIFYSGGVHWFDSKQDTPRTREILKETLDFMQKHL